MWGVPAASGGGAVEPLGNILQKRPVGMACTSGTRTLAAVQFVLVILNLTEDLLAAIFIDVSYGVYLLAFLWAGYAFEMACLKSLANNGPAARGGWSVWSAALLRPGSASSMCTSATEMESCGR